MSVAMENECKKIRIEEKKEVRNLVLAGLEQIKEGNTKDFDEVCDRLEKKYSNAV